MEQLLRLREAVEGDLAEVAIEDPAPALDYWEEPGFYVEAPAVISAAQRKQWAADGVALEDGSWPIPNRDFLRRAIMSFGRAVAAGQAARIKAWITKRARALGLVTMLPKDWGVSEAIEMGDPQQMDFVGPLSEAGETPDGSRWRVAIIRAGTSKNRREYPPEVLREAVPLFEGAKVLARSDQEHLAGANTSVEKLVGWLSDVTYSEGDAAVVGTLNILESAAWLRSMLLDSWGRGKRDLVGLSIVAEGTGAPTGSGTMRVTRITAVSSVDVIVNPAAGGGLIKLVAAADGKEGSMDLEKLLKALREAQDAPTIRALVRAAEALGVPVTSIKEAAPELVTRIDEALVETPPPGEGGNGEGGNEGGDEGKEDAPDVPSAMSRFVVREALAETKLPEPVKARIARDWTGRDFREADLTSAIKSEIEVWATLEKDGLVRSDGDSRLQVGLGEADRGKAALDGFFAMEDVEVEGEKVPRYRSFREAYEELTGDRGVTGQLPHRPSGRLGISEADGGRVRIRLTEAGELQLSTWTQILGDSITRQLVREYAESGLTDWQTLADVVPVKDFRTNRRMRFGGYGDLPGVAELGPYTDFTTPGDEEATYAATKRGGTETISLEAIANDDVGAIRRIPSRLARAAARTLYKFVFDFLGSNSAIYDTKALAHADHANLGSAALSVASLTAARTALFEQTDMSTNEQLGLAIADLWVPIELEQTAFELTASALKPYTADNEANFLARQGITPHAVAYWTDANNWWASTAKADCPLIEVGFYGSETPELFTQDQPNVGSMFDNDTLKYKIRHIYGGAVLDFRGFYGAIVA